MVDKWKVKWQSLKDNAKYKGVECQLTLDEYKSLAQQAGINDPSSIGRNVDKYQLGRYGDVGDYRLGNCRFITMRQNLDERRINGGNAKISSKMMGNPGNGEALRGRSKLTHSGNLEQSLKISKSFRIKSPDGVEYEGINLTDFCKRHDLNQGLMAAVCRGIKKHHKQWSGEYIYE